MDREAKPLMDCLHQFHTNERFFTFIAIVPNENELEYIMDCAEADDSCSDVAYKFDLFHEAYTQSFMKFRNNPYLYYKYRLRFLLYEVQIDHCFTRGAFINFPHKGQDATKELIAASSFFYMVLYSYDCTMKFLRTLEGGDAATVLNLFLECSFLSIVQMIEDLWYMPVIRPPPMPELLKLERIIKLTKDNKFNQEVKIILGINIINPVPNTENIYGKKGQPLVSEIFISPKAKTSHLSNIDPGKFITPLKRPRKKTDESPSNADQGLVISRQRLKQVIIDEEFNLDKSVHISNSGDNKGNTSPNKESLINVSQLKDSKQPTKDLFSVNMSPITQTRTLHPYVNDEFKPKVFTVDKSHKLHHSKLNNSFIIQDSIIDENMTVNENFPNEYSKMSVQNQHNKGYSQIPYVCDSRLRSKFMNTPQKVILSSRSILDRRIIEEEEDLVNQSIVCIDKTFKEDVVNYRYGNYTFLKEIGSGSFSKVFEAVIDGDKRKYAVKVLQFDIHQSKETVLNEINLMKIMNVTDKSIRIFEGHICGIGAIIVMEKALTDMKKFYAEHEATADRFFVCHYWRSMMNCVNTLHKNNIAHLDLKLQNFVLTDNLTVKIIDYGISRLVPKDCDIIDSNSVGTFVFMSPELLLNEGRIQPYKCDIWSMGVVLYTMIFDQQPFNALSYEEYVQKVSETDYQLYMPISQRNCELLRDLMSRCIVRDASERYEAEEVIDIMDRWIE